MSARNPVALELPRELYVEVTNRCNSHCRACVRTFRKPEPLRDLEIKSVLDVTDFGAVPDDEGNDLLGIREALTEATAADVATEVRFPKGRYYLDADIDTEEQAKLTRHALATLRAENVVINGNGAEIIIRTPTTGFLVLYGCKNVIVRDFVVDAEKKLITSPAYMLATSISEAAEGIEKTVDELVNMA